MNAADEICCQKRNSQSCPPGISMQGDKQSEPVMEVSSLVPTRNNSHVTCHDKWTTSHDPKYK